MPDNTIDQKARDDAAAARVIAERTQDHFDIFLTHFEQFQKENNEQHGEVKKAMNDLIRSNDAARREIERNFSEKYVTKERFAPVERIALGLMGLIAIAVVGAMVMVVLR